MIQLQNQITDSTQYIVLEDNVISIMYNDILKKKPFLIRFNNYNNETYEIRVEKKDIEKLINELDILIKGA